MGRVASYHRLLEFPRGSPILRICALHRWFYSVCCIRVVLVAVAIVVREALDFSTGRAIATCIVGWIIYMVIIFLITFLLLGVGAIF